MVKEIRTTGDVRQLINELGLTVVKGYQLRSGADAYMVEDKVVVDASRRAQPSEIVEAVVNCLKEEGYVRVTKKGGKSILIEVWERR